MPWYIARFSAEQVAAGRAVELFDRFIARLRALDYPSELALFCEEVYPASEFYFSPAARNFCRDILSEYDAVPTEPPHHEDLYLIAGNKDSVEVLFPSSDRGRDSSRDQFKD